MPKFRYYIFDPFDGLPSGTDSEKVAKDFAACEDYSVVDTETGVWLDSDLDEIPIQSARGVAE